MYKSSEPRTQTHHAHRRRVRLRDMICQTRERFTNTLFIDAALAALKSSDVLGFQGVQEDIVPTDLCSVDASTLKS